MNTTDLTHSHSVHSAKKILEMNNRTGNTRPDMFHSRFYLYPLGDCIGYREKGGLKSRCNCANGCSSLLSFGGFPFRGGSTSNSHEPIAIAGRFPRPARWFAPSKCIGQPVAATSAVPCSQLPKHCSPTMPSSLMELRQLQRLQPHLPRDRIWCCMPRGRTAIRRKAKKRDSTEQNIYIPYPRRFVWANNKSPDCSPELTGDHVHYPDTPRLWERGKGRELRTQLKAETHPPDAIMPL
ncbi:hypothetical protein B0H65DRAFT_102076 [Neurospora tetraspora]|uniref:Uncharacterized protein n=1 Tax=Neurospora tetraspora TaxID=94610 RepID=A0AAE0JJM9_9PEZI|nr:hypothetical protein B0H65DRAFT_102076 [Neurospora tetraspora]